MMTLASVSNCSILFLQQRLFPDGAHLTRVSDPENKAKRIEK